jgi:predicted nucleic acid-binding protein
MVEVASALNKYVKAGLLEQMRVSDLLEQAESLVSVTTDTRANIVEAAHEAIRLNHSIYDMLYLTLARRNGAVLVSLDKKLNSLAAREGIAVG